MRNVILRKPKGRCHNAPLPKEALFLRFAQRRLEDHRRSPASYGYVR